MLPIETYSKLHIFVKEVKGRKYRIITRKDKEGCRAEVFDLSGIRDIVAVYISKLSLEEFKFDIDDLAKRYNNAEII